VSKTRLTPIDGFKDRSVHCTVLQGGRVIRCIGEGERSTREIFEELGLGEEISLAGLYYHISALKEAEIVELASYREDRGGAPEKVWRLKTRKIVIDLLEE